MNIEIVGTIYKIQDQQDFASGFSKKTIIVQEESDKYPQEYPIDFIKDKIALADGLSEGDRVSLHCNLQGREWVGHDKWFLSLSCWKVEELDEHGFANNTKESEEEEDDFPF